LKKLSITLLLVILTFTLAGCGSKLTSDEELVQIYQQLTLKVFESQNALQEEEIPIELLQETYVEPALSEYIESLQLMRVNNINRVYSNPNFIRVIVLKNDGNLALIKVEAEYKGVDYSIKAPIKNLGTFAFDYFAEVTLKKVKGTWYISEMKPDSPK